MEIDLLSVSKNMDSNTKSIVEHINKLTTTINTALAANRSEMQTLRDNLGTIVQQHVEAAMAPLSTRLSEMEAKVSKITELENKCNALEEQITKLTTKQKEHVAKLEELEDVPRRVSMAEARIYRAAFLISGIAEPPEGEETEEELVQKVRKVVDDIANLPMNCTRFGRKKTDGAPKLDRQILVVLPPWYADAVSYVLGFRLREKWRIRHVRLTKYQTPHMQVARRELGKKLDVLINEHGPDVNYRFIGNQMVTERYGYYVYNSSMRKVEHHAGLPSRFRVDKWSNKAKVAALYGRPADTTVPPAADENNDAINEENEEPIGLVNKTRGSDWHGRAEAPRV